MTESSNLPDNVEQALASFRDAPIPAGPTAHLIAGTAERLRSLGATETCVRENQRRSTMFRMTRYGGAAAVACFLIGGLIWLVLIDRTAGIAFADVQEKVQKVRSIQYVEIRTEDGEAPVTRRHFILGRHLMRVEHIGPNGEVQDISISDAQNGKYVSIRPEAKRFTVMANQVTLNIDGSNRTEEAVKPMPDVDFYQQIRELPADPVKRLPEKTLGERTVVGFYYESQKESSTWKRTYWINPDTKLPVRVEISFTGSDERSVSSDWVLSGFVFDEKLDESLFSTERPAGYTVEEGGFVSIGVE